MKEFYNPFIEHQRKLNPIMKEVVHSEKYKLWNIGIIYAISDSFWISLLQMVPKKSRITIIKNKNNVPFNLGR